MNCKMVEVCKILGINPADIATEESERLSEKYDLPKGTYVNILKAPRTIPMPLVKPAKKESNKIIVLKTPGKLEYDKTTLDEYEKKYSEKFGCKVIILNAGLELIGESDG